MNDQDQATDIAVTLANELRRTMQALNVEWRRAFLRFEVDGPGHWRTNGAYEGVDSVSLLGAIKHAHMYDVVNELGPRLQTATSNHGTQFCVFLLTVDNEFNYKIEYEFDNPKRWMISKLNGASGLPEGLQ